MPNTVGNLVERTLTFAHLVMGGVMDKCPDLKVCLCHGGGYLCYTVDRLLDRLIVSRTTLERQFRRHVGRSPHAEIRNVQLKRVKQLLGETELTLPRVAELAGFDHPEYMSVVFKREVGQTPGRFRREVQADR